MDKRIFITLIGLIFLIGSILLIRWMMNTCEPPIFTYHPISPVVGQIVTFKTDIESGDVKWDFGDGKTNSGVQAINRFDTADTYTVKAIIGDDCEYTVSVIVTAPRKMEKVQPVVNIPAVIHAGEEITFTDETREASSWNWRIKETNELYKEGKSFTTIFNKPGTYTLSVNVNGEYVNGDTTYMIVVLKAEPKKAVAAPAVIVKKTGLTEAELQAKSENNLRAQQKRDEERRLKEERLAADRLRKHKEEKDRLAAIEKSKKNYSSDEVFKRSFMQVTNDLASGDNDASTAWADIIEKQVCEGQSLQIEMTDENNTSSKPNVDAFKRYMLNGQYSVLNVFNPTRGKDKCILKVKVKVQTIIKKED